MSRTLPLHVIGQDMALPKAGRFFRVKVRSPVVPMGMVGRTWLLGSGVPFFRCAYMLSSADWKYRSRGICDERK